MWICVTTWIKWSDWLKTRSGCGILIYSAWQEIRRATRTVGLATACWFCSQDFKSCFRQDSEHDSKVFPGIQPLQCCHLIPIPWWLKHSSWDIKPSNRQEMWQLETINSQVNPSLAEHNMPCLSKQCRSRSVVQRPTDLDLHYLSLNMWNSIKNQNQVIWLAGN